MYFYINQMKKFFSLKANISIFIIFSNLLFVNLINSTELLSNENETVFRKKETNDLNYKSSYLVDSGDVLYIDFKGIEILSGNYKVDEEGYLFLPELGEIYVRGLTRIEIIKKLEEQYKSIIYTPNIEIIISSKRPVNIVITGEVKSPGLYTLDHKDSKYYINKGTESFPNLIGPKLFDALKLAKGVSNNADISKIKIIRKNSINQGGGKISTDINLLNLLKEGDQSQNIFLNDGDNIIVPKSKNPIKEQILSINKTNLNPDKITVYISGNVESPGIFELKRGATLNQAIASAGGNKIFSGKVNFLRFNDDGSNTQNSFNFKKNAKSNSLYNPILMEGDIINVNKNIIGSTTKVLNEISAPILTGYGLYSIF